MDLMVFSLQKPDRRREIHLVASRRPDSLDLHPSNAFRQCLMVGGSKVDPTGRRHYEEHHTGWTIQAQKVVGKAQTLQVTSRVSVWSCPRLPRLYHGHFLELILLLGLHERYALQACFSRPTSDFILRDHFDLHTIRGNGCV